MTTHTLIGRGSIGRRHEQNIRTLRPNDNIFTIDPDPNSDADYNTFVRKDLLHDSIVYICSPTEHHMEHLSMALDAGAKAVYVEKPMAEAGVMIYSPKPKIPVVFGYQYRCHPTVKKIRSKHKGWDGAVFIAHENLSGKYNDSPLSIIACHIIDFCIWINGEALTSKCVDSGFCSSVMMEQDFASTTNIFVDMLTDPRRSTAEIFRDGKAELFTIDRWDSMYTDYLAMFYNYIETGDPQDLALWEDALRVQEVMCS